MFVTFVKKVFQRRQASIPIEEYTVGKNRTNVPRVAKDSRLPATFITTE